MKWSPDNQINAFSQWHLENKWLVFFYYGCLSSAQRPIIDQHPVKQTAYRRAIKYHGYKSVFTISWLVRQRNRSWIKGLGKNPQKSELFHCWQCLLSGATEPWTHGFWETIACIHVSPHNDTSRVTCWQGQGAKHTKIRMRV